MIICYLFIRLWVWWNFEGALILVSKSPNVHLMQVCEWHGIGTEYPVKKEKMCGLTMLVRIETHDKLTFWF